MSVQLIPPVYIAIEGAIGVGKTTLASLLRSQYEANLMLEVFEENPFLPLFYQEPERYGFQVQIEFLLSRYHQQQAICEQAGSTSIISDYLFAKDRLFASLNLEGDEWRTYDRLHHVLAEQIASPDLVIYLRATVDTLMARIAARGRSYERSMSRDYITRLVKVYDDFFASYTSTSLLIIETDHLNVITRPADLALIQRLIEQKVEASPHVTSRVIATSQRDTWSGITN